MVSRYPSGFLREHMKQNATPTQLTPNTKHKSAQGATPAMASTSTPSTWTHVQFDTSMGSFVIELYYRHTPRTCYNIAALAHAGYYNGTIFHRIIKDFMIQGGDPTGTGRGGESVYGGKFEDEITRNLKHVGAGVVSMANAGPNTNGSQFFITLKPTPFLDGKHTIFGRIYSGMGVIQRMGLVATDGEDRPTSEVKIHRAVALFGPPESVSTNNNSVASGEQYAQITAS